MSSAQTPLFSANQTNASNHLIPSRKPSIHLRNPVSESFPMWRNIAKLAISRPPARSALVAAAASSQTRCLLVFPHVPVSKGSSFRFPLLGSIPDPKCHELGFLASRGYTSVAEEVSSTDVEEDPSVVVDEVNELLKEMRKEKKREDHRSWRMKNQEDVGMGRSKYKNLWRRQVKIETEEWERAANEYRELLADMCEQKLAPNLPYVKSLFLGWFEPLRDVIGKEQELFRLGKSKAVYAHYIDQLPADMVAVITMHKLMGHLMTGGDNGCVKVVQAACSVGDAIEQEVG